MKGKKKGSVIDGKKKELVQHIYGLTVSLTESLQLF
jgi:hypothetical protein